jgi:hypothetical protein
MSGAGLLATSSEPVTTACSRWPTWAMSSSASTRSASDELASTTPVTAIHQRVHQLGRTVEGGDRPQNCPEIDVVKTSYLVTHRALGGVSGDRCHEAIAAHADRLMDPHAADMQPDVVKRHLPRHDVLVDRVDQRAVKIQDYDGAAELCARAHPWDVPARVRRMRPARAG